MISKFVRTIFLVSFNNSSLFSFKRMDDFWKYTWATDEEIKNNGIPNILRLKKYTPASFAPKKARIKIGIKLFAILFKVLEGSKNFKIEGLDWIPFFISIGFVFEITVLFLNT